MKDEHDVFNYKGRREGLQGSPGGIGEYDPGNAEARVSGGRRNFFCTYALKDKALSIRI